MMSRSLDGLDEIRCLHSGIADSVSPAVLRQARAALAASWNRVSYAIEVLAFDLEVLKWLPQPNENQLHAIIDGVPDLLAGDLDRARQLPEDTSELVAAAADDDELLDLHRELVSSDLDDPNVAYSLWARMEIRRGGLMTQKYRIEEEITQIRESLLRLYANGTASAEDWLV